MVTLNPEPLPIQAFCCLNPDCPDYGKRNHGNLKFRGHSDTLQLIRLIHCYTCNRRFSERKGTPLFRSQIPKAKAISVAEHLREGVNMRATARLTRVDKDTVARLALKLGNHAQHMHEDLVRTSPSTREVQMDEKWGYVGKKQGKLSEEEKLNEPDLGDRWDHVAQDAESRLNLCLIPGKRTHENSIELVKQVHKRTSGRTDILFTSDEYGGYEEGIAQVYGTKKRIRKRKKKKDPNQFEFWKEKDITPAVEQQLGLPKDLIYATVRKTRKGGRVVKVVQTLVFGTMLILGWMLGRSKASSTINTSFVERVNGTDRSQNARKQRKTYSFSRNRQVHDALGFFVGFSYNFCWCVRTLRLPTEKGGYQQRTPAMAAGLSDHVWNMEEWLTRSVAPV